MSTKKLQIIDYSVKQAENADTLDGKHAVEFASASDVSDLQTKVGDMPVADQITSAVNSAGVLTIDITDAEAGTANLINADSLGGVAASGYVLDSELDTYKSEVETNYATKTEVSTNYLLKTETAADTNKSYGYTLDALKAYMLDLAHPVGSYYWSSESTDPSGLFGGTWEQIKDRFILAAGDGYTVNAEGGEADHTITIDEMPSHTHTPTDNTPGTSTYNQYGMQVIRHLSSASTLRAQVAKGSDYYVNAANPSASDYGSLDDVSVMYKTGATGGGAAHNNMPPYLVAYCWRRTA